MKVLLDVTCDVPNTDVDFIRYAVVDLNPEYVKTIRARGDLLTEAKAKDNELWELWFWDPSLLWLAGTDNRDQTYPMFEPDEHLASELAKKLEINSLVVVPEAAYDELYAIARTELDQLVVDDHGVRWVCMPKHVDYYHSTATLTWETLYQLCYPDVQP